MQQFFQQPVAILAFVSAIATAGLLLVTIDLRTRWNRYFGKRVPADGQLLHDLVQRIVKSEARLDAVEPKIDALEAVARVSVQKVGFLRFNPFNDTGGDQSFSLALLDGENNGVVVSGLYTREGTRVYAKEVVSGVSKQALSDEEKKVLARALGKS